MNHNTELIIKHFAYKVKNSKEYASYKDCDFEELAYILCIKFAHVFEKMLAKRERNHLSTIDYRFKLREEMFVFSTPEIETKGYAYTIGSLLDVYQLLSDSKDNYVCKYLDVLGIEDETDFLEGILLAELEISYADEILDNVKWISNKDKLPNIKLAVFDYPM